MKKKVLLSKLLLSGLALLSIGSLFAQTCPTGLVSNWKMDNIGGLTLVDSKSGHNATSNVELATDENGKVGVSQYFSFGDWASVPNNPAFNIDANTSFSIVYWMKFSEYTYGTQDHVIVSKGDYGGGSPLGAFFSSGINGSALVNFLVKDESLDYQEIETTTNYTDNLWHQVACVLDRASHKMLIYVDGIERAQKIHDFAGGFTNTYDLNFGFLLSHDVMGYFYKGSMDEVAFFNRALTPAEITGFIDNANIGVGLCDAPSPNIFSIPKTTASVGSLYNYTVRAGGDKTNMQYSLVKKPSGMAINSTSGLISWTPAAIDADGSVKVRADNTIAPADTQSFRIYVSEAAVCPSNLMLLLKLDETSGPLYSDYYGAHNGTAITAPSATTGKIKGAQLFDATSKTKVNIPDGGSEFDWGSAASFTFECWIKTNTKAAMVAIARNRVDYSETGTSWFIGTDANGKATFELRDNSTTVSSALSGIKQMNDGVWHHIMGVRNGATKTNILYVDGIEEASASVDYPTTFSADDPTDVTVGYILRSTVDKPAYYFNGSIDEVAIYNRAVTASEASTFYNGGNPTGHCALGNFAPVITSDPIVSANEGAPYSYTFKTDDIDLADILTLSAVTKPSWATFTWTAGQKNATLTGTPGSAAVGANNVTLRVSDGHVQKDQAFVINVVDVNNAPVVSSTPVSTVNEDEAYSYTITVTDADVADVISMNVVSKPSWLTFTHAAGARTATLTGTPGNGDTGTSTVDISITDGHATIDHSYSLEVVAVNDAPVISAQLTLSTNEDVALTLQKSDFTITDVDNPSTDVTLKVQAGTNYSVVGNTITPAANFNGQLTVNVIASDLALNSQVFQAAVTVVAVNDPPVVTSVAIENAQVGKLYAFIFDATDPDDATLTKSVVQKPDWLQFAAATGVLTGTPAAGDEGQNLVILSVTDGKVPVDFDFIITVAAASGINDLESAGIRIYPVPAKDYLDMQFEQLNEETNLEVVNSNGSIVKKAVIPANLSNYRLDLGGIESGTYYLHINNSTLNNIGRIVVVK